MSLRTWFHGPRQRLLVFLVIVLLPSTLLGARDESRPLSRDDIRIRGTAPWRLLIAPTESGTPQRELARTTRGGVPDGGGNASLAWSADGRFLYYAKQFVA